MLIIVRVLQQYCGIILADQAMVILNKKQNIFLGVLLQRHLMQ